MAGEEEGLFKLRFSGVSSVWCCVMDPGLEFLVLWELVVPVGGALWSLGPWGDLGAATVPLLLFEAPLRELRGGESDLLKSRLALPMESPDLRLGRACLRLGPAPDGPGEALL